jgi:hypothetical protein
MQPRAGLVPVVVTVKRGLSVLRQTAEPNGAGFVQQSVNREQRGTNGNPPDGSAFFVARSTGHERAEDVEPVVCRTRRTIAHDKPESIESADGDDVTYQNEQCQTERQTFRKARQSNDHKAQRIAHLSFPRKKFRQQHDPFVLADFQHPV